MFTFKKQRFEQQSDDNFHRRVYLPNVTRTVIGDRHPSPRRHSARIAAE
jgi:hypothetical protein